MVAAAVVVALLLAACDGAATPTIAPTPTISPYTGYLTEEIPPCTPVAGSSVDPCAPDAEQYSITGPVHIHPPHRDDGVTSVRELLESFPGFESHIVLRGTYLPNTVRCTADNPYRPQSYRSHDEYDLVEYALSFDCYVNVKVGDYILGKGPSALTVQRYWYTYWEIGPDDSTFEALQTEREEKEDFRQLLESTEYLSVIYGREVVLFLGPTSSLDTEVWQVFVIWDVQRLEDGTVVAVHPERDLWRHYLPEDYEIHRSTLEVSLLALGQAVTAANQARVAEYGGRIAADSNYPMLIADVHQLRQYFTAVGAYDHPAGPPAQPPAVYACDNGTAVTNPGSNRGLVNDCEALLAAKDSLRGTGALNWSADVSLPDWGGVTTSGTPARVTGLALPGKELSGSVPAELGKLFELTHLDLSGNSLAGRIPAEMGWLPDLVEVRLAGNSFAGCIPATLKDVTTKDLSSLSILYCPPVPANLTPGTPTEYSVPLSWDAVPDAAKYRVEYLPVTPGTWTDWVLYDDSIATSIHTVDGLACETWYVFRVSAYGNGTDYAAEWGERTAPNGALTATCPTPPAAR